MRGVGRARELAAFLGAVVVSTAGTRMSFLAVPWLVLSTTGSAVATGLVAFAEMAPYVTAQALSGPAVDRVGARRASVATDVAAALCTALVPVLFSLHLLSLPLLSLAVAAAGAARGVGDNARGVLLPGVSAGAGVAIDRASGLYDGASRLAGLAGLPAAGLIVALSSPLAALLVDAATFAVSAGLVAAFVSGAAEPAHEGGEAEGYLATLAEGLRHLWGDRLLVGVAAMVLVTNFIDQAGGAVLVPVWAHGVAHSPVALGTLGGLLSLGSVGGNALATWLAPRLPRRLTYAVGFLLAGAPRYAALALATRLSPVLAVVAVLGGLGAGSINPVLGATFYERVPRPLQARVLGVFGASAWAGIPFGSLAAGAAVALVGLRVSLLGAAALYLLTTLAPFVLPVWRAMDRRPAPVGQAVDEAPVDVPGGG